MIHRFWLRDKKRALTKSVAYDLIKGIHVTEKSVDGAKLRNLLVLKVSLDANKIDIKKAVEMIFELPVLSVNTMVSKPRLRSFKGKMARRSPFKKAIVAIDKKVDITKMFGEAHGA